MHISRLILKQYKRLMLSNIQTMEWTPASQLMVILGSNGSGKSSILEEFTPLPSHQDNFAKAGDGGYKQVDITHQDREYVLKSVYQGGTGKHSFVLEGEELNPGGTMATQKQLVEQHFKITRAIHEVLVGIKRFTLMSTKERREWLTLLSPMDLTYSFQRYNQVKSLHRDQQGVIKHITKRMTLENVDLPDDQELASLRVNIQMLTTKLNRLFQARGPELKASFHSNEQVMQQLTGLLHRGKRVLTQYPTLVGDSTTTTQEGYLERLGELGQAVRAHESMLDHFMHELHELQIKEPSKDELMTEAELTTLQASIQALASQVVEARAKDGQYSGRLPLVDLDFDHASVEGLNTMVDRWLQLINQFPSNEDSYMNPTRGREVQELLKHHKYERNRLESEQSHLARRLASLKGCVAVVCPNCTHSFQPGVDASEFGVIDSKLDAVVAQLIQHEQQLKELEAYAEQYQQYSGLVFQFRSLTSDYAQFKALWEYTAETRLMFLAPKQYVTDIVGWQQAMTNRYALGKAEVSLKRQQLKLEVAQSYDRDAIGFMANKRQQLESTIEAKTHEHIHSKQTLREYKASGEAIVQFEAEANQAIKDLLGFYDKLNNQMKFLVQQGVDAEIQELQFQMSEARSYLSRLEMREHTLKSLEAEHKQAVEFHHDLNILVKSLSPTDGLIGRYLLGFMQAMVGLMNDIIREIWTHPLEVLPSKVDSDELTYVFPLDVNDGAVIAPDIALGSAGQRDIVDFAFKVLAMKFLGMENYPLYLDEFGSTFDEAHRQNLVPFLLQLIELNAFGQIVYISHFASTHGAFNQAEFVVVDPTNVTVPATYNRNVVLA